MLTQSQVHREGLRGVMRRKVELQARRVSLGEIRLARFRHEQSCGRCARGIGCRMGEALDSLHHGDTVEAYA